MTYTFALLMTLLSAEAPLPSLPSNDLKRLVEVSLNPNQSPEMRSLAVQKLITMIEMGRGIRAIIKKTPTIKSQPLWKTIALRAIQRGDYEAMQRIARRLAHEDEAIQEMALQQLNDVLTQPVITADSFDLAKNIFIVDGLADSLQSIYERSRLVYPTLLVAMKNTTQNRKLTESVHRELLRAETR